MLIDQDDLVQMTTQAMMARQTEQIRLRRINHYIARKARPATRAERRHR